MKTSYFGNRSLDRDVHFLVPVCNYAPKSYPVDGAFPEAVPGWQALVRPYKEGAIDEKEYEAAYARSLDGRRDEVLRGARRILEEAGGREPVLLCYEKPADFCHRHILARWLRKEGFDISEL